MKTTKPIVYLSKLPVFSTMTDATKRIICRSINRMSRGGHPMPDAATVGQFAVKFAAQMLKKDKEEAMANALLEALAAYEKEQSAPKGKTLKLSGKMKVIPIQRDEERDAEHDFGTVMQFAERMGIIGTGAEWNDCFEQADVMLCELLPLSEEQFAKAEDLAKLANVRNAFSFAHWLRAFADIVEGKK